MILDAFINQNIGKKVDFDGVYGAQCVDLFRQYCKDVLKVPHTGSVEGAKDLFFKYDQLPVEKKYFEKVALCPRVGDVAIWGSTESNKYGHVAIFLGVVDDNHVLVFEQDGFKQDGAKIKTRSAVNLLGYLRVRSDTL